MQINLKSGLTSVPNMIPTIDILFQLVIFFMLACQFAVVEQFPIPVPDECAYAAPARPDQLSLTITMARNEAGQVLLAVGSEKITVSHDKDLTDEIIELINEAIPDPKMHGIVCLRIARDMPFAEYQYALKAVAKSNAAEIKMAVLKEKDEGQ
jgi:biopolymer transport protein ExbD